MTDVLALMLSAWLAEEIVAADSTARRDAL
jgi:hypothetical protein